MYSLGKNCLWLPQYTQHRLVTSLANIPITPQTLKQEVLPHPLLEMALSRWINPAVQKTHMAQDVKKSMKKCDNVQCTETCSAYLFVYATIFRQLDKGASSIKDDLDLYSLYSDICR